MIAVTFDKHLYYPLLSIEKNADLPLKCVQQHLMHRAKLPSLRIYKNLLKHQKVKTIGNKSLYLLRNADSKAKGLGFATAGNFYPDFYYG